MRKLVVSLVMGGLLSLSSTFALAQSQGAMEAYLCTLNDGKSLVDVMGCVGVGREV